MRQGPPFSFTSGVPVSCLVPYLARTGLYDTYAFTFTMIPSRPVGLTINTTISSRKA